MNRQPASYFSRVSGRGFLWAAVFLGWLGWGAALPAQFVPPNSNYEVRFSDYFGQLKAYGYVNVHFTITRIGSQADRAETLYVGADSRSYTYRGQYRREVMTRVDFEPGQTTASADVNVLLIPEYGQSHLVVSRDASMSSTPRRDLIAAIDAPKWHGSWRSVAATEGLGLAFFSAQGALDTGHHQYMYRMQDGSRAHGLVKGPTVEQAGVSIPSYSQLALVLANDSARESEGAVASPTDPNLVAAIENRFIVAGGLQAIPENWLGLNPVDVAFLSVTDLSTLAGRYPKRLEALRQWVVSGGRLVVSDCGADYAGLPSIMSNLNSASGHPLSSDRQQWSRLQPKLLDQISEGYVRMRDQYQSQISGQNVQTGYYNSNWNRNPVLDWLLGQDVGKNSQRMVGLPRDIAQTAAAEAVPLMISPLGSGKVVALPTDLATLNQQDWTRILVASCGDGAPLSHAGIGYVQHGWTGIDDFSVAGVGQPPWMLFLVLITLFALLVGPVAFGILKRNGRPHLLLAVVPGIAAVITIGIVTYSVIQDGLGFRTSRISVTWLDTRNQVALVQTSQAIYAGLAPGRFQVKPDMAVYDNSLTDRLRAGQLRIQRDDQTQTLSGGRIMARTKHQMTTFDVTRHTGTVRVSAAPDGSRWEVVNELGYPVDLLIIRTPLGVMWVEDLAEGATGQLNDQETQSVDLARRMAAYGKAGLPDSLRMRGTGDDWHRGYGRISQALGLLNGGGNPINRLEVNHFVAVSSQQPLALDLHPRPQRELEWHLTTGEFQMASPLPQSNVPETDSADEGSPADPAVEEASAAGEGDSGDDLSGQGERP